MNAPTPRTPGSSYPNGPAVPFVPSAEVCAKADALEADGPIDLTIGPVERVHAPLISSQRFLDRATVMHKARTFKVFVVRKLYIELRGVMYWVLLDGHHNLAAARMLGVEPAWRGPSRKTQRVMREMGQEAFAQFLVNNLTDSDWYDVDTGKVVDALR